MSDQAEPEPEVAGSPSSRTQVKRLPELGAYDSATIDAILDAGLVAHLGFTHEEQPFVVPTLAARLGDELYVHGSAASRTLREVSGEIAICVTVTLLDGLVLARSIFEHSINYRSVMVFGRARLVTDADEKLAALHAFSEHILPGRWNDVREPNDQELKATSILALPLTEASAKISAGPPDDGESEDAKLPVWAGEIPLAVAVGEPVKAPEVSDDIPMPDYVRDYRRPGLTE